MTASFLFFHLGTADWSGAFLDALQDVQQHPEREDLRTLKIITLREGRSADAMAMSGVIPLSCGHFASKKGRNSGFSSK